MRVLCRPVDRERIASAAGCASGSTSRTARTCSSCGRSSRRCARRATTCRSPPATSRRRSACSSASASSTPRSAATAAASSRRRGSGLLSRSAALARWARGRRFDLALGHGSNDVTVAARLLRIPCSTMFDYEWATVQHTVNCRLAQTVVVPDAIPPERLARYGATGQDRRLRGPQGGVLPRRLRARPGGPRRARPRPGRADRRRPHAARGLAVSPLRERRPRRDARAPARHADRRPAAHARSSAPSCATAASSCPSRRSTPSR